MATTFDLVRRFFPNATDDECEFFLWETTAYPMGGLMTIARQLKQNKKAVDNNQSVCPCCGKSFDNDGKVSFYDVCRPCHEDNYRDT